MKHLFLNEELSQLAKEKGFNEPCLFGYKKNGNPTKIDGDLYNNFYTKKELGEPPYFFSEKVQFDKFVENKIPKFSGLCTAPLYQQIIDWFRDNHHIRITDSISKSCMSSTLETKFQFNIIKIDGLYTKDMLWSSGMDSLIYDSYYEALDEAIKQAFKLI